MEIKVIKLALLAIGGDSLIKDKQDESVEDQYDAVCETTKHIGAPKELGIPYAREGK